MLDIQPLVAGGICHVQNGFCVLFVFSSCVNFQFNAKYPLSISVEDRLRTIGVIVYQSFSCAAVAMVAAGLIIIVVGVICIIMVQHPAAVLAAGIVAVIASLAQGGIAVSGVGICPNPFSAVLTEDGFGSQTGGTQPVIIKFRQLLHRMQCAADTAGFHFFHSTLPPENKNSAWRKLHAVIQEDNI